MTDFIAPGQPGSKVNYASRYDHWINGEYVQPDSGQYFENVTPVTGKVFCEVARGNAKDIDKALDAAHAAAPAWGKTSATERAIILNKIADRMEANVEAIAVAETWENGKPIREALYVDIPLAIDHFRYFAAAIRAQEGSAGELDHDTVAYHFHEPLGVVGQIIPWNFPILMAVWKLAPAIAAGNCVVLKPAEQTPVSILFLMDIIKDLLPPGVVNIVNGFGVEAGKPLASSPRIAKIAFTGETTTGRLIMQYASENIIPVTLELGGKSPNIFFNDVAAENDAFYDKALAAGVGLGTSVVTSPITFVASANAARYCGADVLFADIDPETINMSPDALREVLLKNSNIKAIIPVHFAGLPCDMVAIKNLADDAGVIVIEDARDS